MGSEGEASEKMAAKVSLSEMHKNVSTGIGPTRVRCRDPESFQTGMSVVEALMSKNQRDWGLVDLDSRWLRRD